ncbi:MAG TPA: glycosyl hydrolase [Actinomycetota bacterium]|nr:glycosyl hydrolase [Actinomycetota bacterium]
MRLRPLIPALLLALALPTPTSIPGDASATAHAGSASFIDDATLQLLGFRGGSHPAEPSGDWLLRQRAGEDGAIPRDAYARALDQAREIGAMTERAAPEVASATWEAMGPTNIGGRVTGLAVDPTRGTVAVNAGGARTVVNSHVYAATASGGVWRSSDAGATWAYRWNRDLTQSIGAIAIGSDGWIHVGTGETNPGGGSVTWGGTGMYRSKDGGATWQQTGLPTSGRIAHVVVDPTDPKRVFVAASGNLFVPGGERGIYRSLDGGDTWTRVLAGDNPTTGGSFLAIDPKDPNNVLAGMWDHRRFPTHRRYAGPGSGVYRSTDGGSTWARVTLPGAPAPEQVGRIGVAFAPSDPSRAYAIIANNLAGNGVGLWRSNDGGATWTKTAAAVDGTGATGVNGLSQSSYGWWFGKLWVDPLRPDRVFVAGVELVESLNGGDTFFPHGNTTAMVVSGANQAYPHADQHAMIWDPLVPNRVYLGNDGGIYVSEANAQVGTWRAAAVQGWTQHYSVDVSEQNPRRVVSGLQDNMCQRNYLAGEGGHPHTWTKFGLCGDGLQTLVNPTNENVIYGCAQYGNNCSRTGNDGHVSSSLSPLLGALPRVPGDRHGWWVPLVFDPNDPSIMYGGSNRVARSTSGGTSWTTISPDLTTNPPQQDPNSSYRIYGTITTIAVSKSDGNVLHVGTDDGLLWRTTNRGQSWTKLDDEVDPEDPEDTDDIPDGQWVTSVAIDPSDHRTAYATFSGFREGNASPLVVRTRNGGTRWDDISGNLPAAPVNDLAILPGDRLVVGTDVGVYLTSDAGATWFRVGSNLPAIPVLDLRYHAATNSLTVSTFGHGIQRVVLPA